MSVLLSKEKIYTIEMYDAVRKVDGVGRLSIPSQLRKSLGIELGDTVEFGSLIYDGEPQYILIKKNHGIDPRYKIAAEVLNELGLDVPEVLINGNKDEI